MAVELITLLRHLREPFAVCRCDGTFELRGGLLTPMPDEPTEGDLLVIRGSLRNEGTHEIRDGLLCDTADEAFCGTVWLLRPPAELRRLCVRISRWDDEHPQGLPEAESFGHYSVKHGKAEDWRGHFREELRPWQRMFCEVPM